MWPGSICLTPSFERVGRIQRVLLGMTRSREIDLRRRGLSGRRYYTLESKVEITYPCFLKSMSWGAKPTDVWQRICYQGVVAVPLIHL